jgi:bifunctional UDP-N-acetylglucosamine pyrophosphorylase/glucosamine-1-phosphate N-acetyltransferase
MRSAVPKPLHAVAGLPMLGHVLAAASAAGADTLAVVIGPDRDDVAGQARALATEAEIVVQRERRGTAHAVLAAREVIARGFDDVLVLYADVPLVTAETLRRLRQPLVEGATVAVLGFEAADPTGYGRLLGEGTGLSAIREHKDATAAERAVRACNAGLMAIDGRAALRLLDAIGCGNVQGEFYLTDIVEVAVREGLRCAAVTTGEAEVMGVNDRVQLAAAEQAMQHRLREAAMRGGATLVAPETVFLCHDTVLGRDVLVEPHCVFGPKVRIEDGVVIHAFSHLEGATVRTGASVGPFARLRPGAVLGKDAKVGNFVEVKNAAVEAGAKVSHLSYIGDATVGAGANLGAGTITCIYDGFNKARTTIGAGAFIGSNSALVAPVTIGAGAFVGSGSVVTEDVEADALALGRARQVNKPGRAAQLRTELKARKAAARPA